jgi:hypothetical protein
MRRIRYGFGDATHWICFIVALTDHLLSRCLFYRELEGIIPYEFESPIMEVVKR